VCALAVTDSESGRVVIFDGKGEATGPLHTFDKLHSRPVSVIEFVPAYDCVVSIDEAGMVEYWTGPKYDYQFPTTVQWQYKTDTDLYEFAKCKTMPVSLCIAPDGRSFATYAVDRRVRIFRTGTGKLTKVIDETLPVYTQDRARHGLSVVEFNRRMQVERELDRTPESFALQRIDFDMSGNFLLCPCMLGIKCINLTTNECVRVIGALG
jgi:peptidylprolyl isomerase domain and WD repeat-containing protein 1